MSDAVKLGLIQQLPAIITALAALTAAIVGFMNRRKLGKVEGNVDGKMTALANEVRDLQNALMGSRVDAAHAKGMKDEKEGKA